MKVPSFLRLLDDDSVEVQLRGKYTPGSDERTVVCVRPSTVHDSIAAQDAIPANRKTNFSEHAARLLARTVSVGGLPKVEYAFIASMRKVDFDRLQEAQAWADRDPDLDSEAAAADGPLDEAGAEG